MTDRLLTIGEVGAQVGLATSAIRYYERRGLVQADARVSGQRRYRRETVRRLVFVGMLQDAGYRVSVGAYQLAQLNIARARGAPDSPVMAEFMAALDQINALAEATPGYVWRLQTGDGNATAYRAFDDERLLLNLTVWETVEALAEFVYHSKHVEVMRRRADWFEHMSEAYLVLWWVPAGHHPTVAEAEDRLRHLRTQGPTRHAFTIRRTFPPPGDTDQPDDAMIDNRWACPAG